MKTSIFVNMQVKDLDKSKKFYEGLGYSFNEQFTDETAASLVISDTIYAMLLTPEKFKSFIKNKEASDAHKSTEVLLALSMESKQEVDCMLKKAEDAGGKAFRDTEDYGFMYSRSFEDLDGHIWEIFWMDPDYVQK